MGLILRLGGVYETRGDSLSPGGGGRTLPTLLVELTSYPGAVRHELRHVTMVTICSERELIVASATR